MGIPDCLGQLYGLGVGQHRAGRVGVDSHRHLHRLENARISRTTDARKTQPRFTAGAFLLLRWRSERSAGATRTADLCLLYKVQKWPWQSNMRVRTAVINLGADEVFKNEEGYAIFNGSPDHGGTGSILHMKEGRLVPARAKSKTEANRI